MKPTKQLGFAEQYLPRALEALSALHRGELWQLVHGDSLKILEALPSESVDLLFCDPPYNLSNGGTTCSGGERVAVEKGAWDVSRGLDEDRAWHRAWLTAARRALKPSGTIWVSGTHHVIFTLGYAMQEIGYHLLNTVTWAKPNPPPNLGCRQFTHSTEFLVWAAPAEYNPLQHTFHYGELKAENDDKQMKDVWEITAPTEREKDCNGDEGGHPCQKPIALLDRIVRASSSPGDLVVDPFNGSGTTGLVAVANGRRYLGIDLDARYLDLTARRLAAGLPR